LSGHEKGMAGVGRYVQRRRLGERQMGVHSVKPVGDYPQRACVLATPSRLGVAMVGGRRDRVPKTRRPQR
jgi:hypothetical protein